ncbi:retrovirus-related pol polyprotein from transposon TNT 1-94 [Tanacetum coccineum]|uniref:Retrovirus-related pol polyprotein from transposon TNT 1-94 n=1 Tax=Tanacetum coccineum TaxID=301880 RepID=A0ABQ5HI92_9ASTR
MRHQKLIKDLPEAITVLLQSTLVERRNQTLVEAEAIATACYTQNRSIIHRRFNKTPYELINGRKPDISFLTIRVPRLSPRMIVKILGSLVQKVILASSLVILLILVLTEFIAEGQRKS